MMLNSVPQEWGPKIEHEGIAVARTHTGPNAIEFTAPANMALVMFTPQPRREVGLNSDRGRVSEVVEIGWRRNLRVNQHPPNRRRQPPGRSRHEAEYRQLILFATA